MLERTFRPGLRRSCAMSQPFLWRRVNDSSGFAEPRVFIRVYLEPGSIDAAIAFYEDLQGVAHDMRFDFPEKRLTLAAVGAFLLLEGSDEALAPFRSTTGTLLVDDIELYHRRLLAAGAQIIFGPARAPTGACFNALLPDGTVVEFVHHRPQPGEA
ncbi:TPA: VOC family protein [Pseudomonas aeruginosa]|nr:VOC family protein [Pseudomonas aeruginosa]